MHKGCIESVIATCLLGMVLMATPALADWTGTEGMYGLCYRIDSLGHRTPADTSTVYAKIQINGPTYTDVTGDDYPTLPRHVARFADYTPPGTYVPSDTLYRMRARKVYGDMIWESPWTDLLDYYDGAHIDRDLDMVFSGAGQK